MRPHLSLILATCILIAADDPADQAMRKEMKYLEGSWLVVASEIGGRKLQEKEFRVERLTFRGDKVTMKAPGLDASEEFYKVDPTKRPRNIDLTNPKDRKVIPAIYIMEGNDLKICYPMAPMDKETELKRPQSFETKDKPLMLLVCRRQKG